MSDITFDVPFDIGTDLTSEDISVGGIPTFTTSFQNGTFTFLRPVRYAELYASVPVDELVLQLAENVSIAEEIARVSRSTEKLTLERTILGFLRSDYLDDSEAEQQLTAAVPEALVFLNELPAEAPLPTATLASDGIITLEWDQGSKKAAAIFEGEDDYGYTYFNGEKFVAGEFVGKAGAGIPRDLNSFLTK